ncbi:glycopeptide [Rickenella mellea]|uniref:Glycopeptide n=1 Tax=Rickenella mellea TaxID=50990 RepID=A0A4Y7PWB7_9AGAM|nr:glycopeptide [Rickenella mellea]
MFKTLLFLVATVVAVIAETHTVHFQNKCGFGTPTLVFGGQIVSTGADFTANGPITGIAYLQTGSCGFNGENCTTVEITLKNSNSPGDASSTDINKVPPHAFSVTTGFGYFNGCDGAGADCTSAFCLPPLTPGGPTNVECQTNNVNLAVVFCG